MSSTINNDEFGDQEIAKRKLEVSSAQSSLALLQSRIDKFEEWEKEEIDDMKTHLRGLIATYDSSAQLAILCLSFEIAIAKGL